MAFEFELPKKKVQKVLRFKTGESIPEGAVFLNSGHELLEDSGTTGKYHKTFYHFFKVVFIVLNIKNI